MDVDPGLKTMMSQQFQELLDAGYSSVDILDLHVASGIAGLVLAGGTRTEILVLVGAILDKLDAMLAREPGLGN